jgi:integrase
MQFLDSFDDGFLGLRNKSLFLLFFNTGCRLSEVLADNYGRVGIQIQDIDWDKRTIIVLGKGGTERLVGIQIPTAKALWAYYAARKKRFPYTTENSFFLTEEGKVLHGEAFRSLMERMGDFRPHDLRRAFCTYCASSGMNDTAAMALTGHKSHLMYERYTKNYKVQTALAELEKHSPVAGL